MPLMPFPTVPHTHHQLFLLRGALLIVPCFLQACLAVNTRHRLSPRGQGWGGTVFKGHRWARVYLWSWTQETGAGGLWLGCQLETRGPVPGGEGDTGGADREGQRSISLHADKPPGCPRGATAMPGPEGTTRGCRLGTPVSMNHRDPRWPQVTARGGGDGAAA